jgi:HEAT repeat protein
MLLALLMAVTVAQTPAASKRPRAAVAIAPLAVTDMALQQAAIALAEAQPQLHALGMHAPALAAAQAQLDMVAAQLPMMLAPLAAVGPALAIEPFDLDVDVDLEMWDTQDPGDSLYRAARQALNNSQYARAAELFHAVYERYARSTHAANAYYWEAFALYRTGSDDALRAARTALRTQAERHATATTRRDAEVLLRRIQGELARRGDAEAAEAITAAAEAEGDKPKPPRPAQAPRPPREPRSGRGSSSCGDDDDMRIAALNAVLQMDSERAVPLLKSVLARRDEGSACLRKTAVFLVSQKRTSETAQILLSAVRSDPDRQVRLDAIFWLSQVPGEETVMALDSVLRATDDPAVQEKAIYAIAQNRSPRGAAILRDFATRQNVPLKMREDAIFWLGQRRSQENAEFLRGLYQKLETDHLKEKVIFSVSQMGGAENYRWMMDIALNENESMHLRKQGLFWASQGRNADMADLVRLYDRMKDREMREQLIFVYSQRRDAAALDKLFEIGKNDPDRELRKKAIFWIGQSRDPRAAQFLQELINQ